MKARDVMTLHVITVGPDMNIRAVANTLIKNKISAVPVAGIDCKLLGIVSEGDLIGASRRGRRAAAPGGSIYSPRAIGWRRNSPNPTRKKPRMS